MGKAYQTFNLVSKDGTVLRGHSWRPAGYPVATLCLVHGIGEHGGRYNDWALRFSGQGIMVYSLDYRGHGKSEGKRGHINSLFDLLDDIGALIKHCKRNWIDLPCFIYGHSMGGNLVLNYLDLRRQDFTGGIISSPWLKLSNPPKAVLQKLVKYLDFILPAFRFSTGFKAGQMTSTPNETEEADKDPFMHSFISVRMFNELNKSSERLLSNQVKIEVPLLLFHGECDSITSAEGSFQFYNKHIANCSFCTYADCLHEIHRDVIADDLFDDIIVWMREKIASNK